MIQLCKRCEDIEKSFFPDTQTEIHVIECHGKALIQSAQFFVKRFGNHHTGACYCCDILCIAEPAHIADISFRDPVMRVSGCAMCAQSDHDTCMLDRFIRIIELRSHSCHILTLRIHQKLLHPVHRNHLRIIIQ